MNEEEAIQILKNMDIKISGTSTCKECIYNDEIHCFRDGKDCQMQAIETVLNLIQTQQTEIEESINTKDLYYENKELRKLLKKKDKEKELIYDFLYKFGSKFSGSFMKALSEDGFDIKKCENCEYETCDCKECIKQYFERKVENGN